MASSNDFKKSVLSAEAPEFIPTANYSFPERSTAEDVPQGDVSAAVLATDRVMLKLLTNPEAFSKVAGPLVENLSTSISDSATLEAVVEHIFQQSILHVNYQYTGARLCSLLAEKLQLNFKSESFRQILLKRCQAEYNKHTELSKDKESFEELVGFTLFFAELMLSLKVGDLVKIFTPKILNLLCILLSVPNEETIKCVNKVLKLTGSALEANAEELDNVFARIKDIVVADSTSKQLRCILLNLVTLRAQKWEPEDKSTSVQNGNVPVDTNLVEPEYDDEGGELYDEFDYHSSYPNYGGAEGYTPEGYGAEDFNHEDYESWEATQVPFGDYGGIPYVVGDDEMDPDMDEAYEQFLATLNQ